MTSLGASEIVALWEAYRHASATTRAVGVVATALACESEAIAELPIGRRDAALVQVRCSTWGPRADCHTACPSCGADLELELDLETFTAAAAEVSGSSDEHTLVHDDVEIRFRLLNSFDLWAAESAAEATAEEELLERCVVAASRHGDPIAPTRIVGESREALAAELARLDPLADIRLALSCAACAHTWAASFDVANYVWRELDLEAQRLLAIVDALARAYGWSESEILSLGPERRRFYLERVGAL